MTKWEEEIKRCLAGGKPYQIREIEKLISKLLDSQRAEVEEKIFHNINICPKCCKEVRGTLDQLEGLSIRTEGR
jgi:hypothetical protein